MEGNEERRDRLQVTDVTKTLQLIQAQHDLCCEMLDVAASKQMYTEAEMENYLEWWEFKERVGAWLEAQPAPRADDTEMAFSEIQRLMTVAALRIAVFDHEPRRLDVFAADGRNYYESEMRTIILDEYKTATKYGTQRTVLYCMQVSEETGKILDILIAYGKKHDRQYVFGPLEEPETFTYTAHSAWSSRFLSTAMHKATGKAINCDLLRKLYIEFAQKEGLFDDPLARRAISNRMAHDVRTQVKYYAKDVGRSGKKRNVEAVDADAEADSESGRQRKRTVITDEQKAALWEVKVEQEAMQGTTG
ncbi:uncharacterized protein EV422DRAFT_610517 [Fimicolochytrium jonesii]|uniref:uncharacterized protein n=1 Tax=Fimicolochytrium jonesii TaxID=1396493 RepID=UPI0022FEBDB1|nr:uncharacterized protein EV422DRAFT_610517 [Fimicolochytrium jonesii]KAI8815907.1 hypothetical protein EV422DRAFT_610517 [Fimicolochytrium jonesii]